jgi:outer membrane lipoprotein-sorting protein
MKKMLMMVVMVVVTGTLAVAVETGIDPAVEKIIGKLAENMQKAQRLSCVMTLLMHNEMEGMKQEITTTYAVAIERPAKLAMRQVKGMPTFTVVSDGTNVYSLLPMMNRYSVGVAPKTYDEFVE